MRILVRMMLNKFCILLITHTITSIFFLHFLTVIYILINVNILFFGFLLIRNRSFTRTNGRRIIDFNFNIHIELLQFSFFFFRSIRTLIDLISNFLIKFILTFLHQLLSRLIVFRLFKTLLLLIII